MTENFADSFQREGAPAFSNEGSTEETTSADSQSENENQEENTQAAEGENTRQEETIPFNQQERWHKREVEWNDKFADQERRHQADIQAIRDEFGTARKENREATQIPAWFGGDQAQWDAYRQDRDAELKAAEDRAYDRLKSEGESSQKAIEDATKWLQDEVSAIESDPTLNPTGAKVDPEKLFKIVYDNQLIDAQGRWNYRAGFKLMNASSGAPAPKPNTQKKQDAAATTEGKGSGETKPAPFKTSADFKGSKRPW